MDTQARIAYLVSEILRHQSLYYLNAQPEISDSAYDSLFDELVGLERKYPHLADPNSPTLRVGSDLDNTFPEQHHTVPVLSLNKEQSLDGLNGWLEKILTKADGSVSFVVEQKIDGASIVLYFREGKLDAALTRGNGIMGNNVSANIRTIRQIPLRIPELGDLAVRGEIYINKADFFELNRKFDGHYANPRNLAAGSLRNIKSAVVAKIPLNIFCYEGYFQHKAPNNHGLILDRLSGLGFRINREMAFFSDDQEKRLLLEGLFPGLRIGTTDELSLFVSEQIDQRDQLDYDIDGLVVKVNEVDFRDRLGYTAHHPRWAVAYKFESPLAQTRLIDVQIGIGRNGRVSPVALLEPVKLAGSVVSRATLHNQEYIDLLELGAGDTVSISKRGDIIPAVEKVVEKSVDQPSVFRFPVNCPFCTSSLVKDGGHHFCPNRQCPERRKRAIIYFVSKGCMDIDTLGEKTISFLFDKGFVRDIIDLYRFDFDRLLDEEGFKEKKVENIKKSLLESKTRPFQRVLKSLGFDGIGDTVVKLLIRNGFDSIDKIVNTVQAERAEVFSEIEGFGGITADLIMKHFRDETNLGLIRALAETGLILAEVSAGTDQPDQVFSGQIWVITGSFEHFNSRNSAVAEIEKRGGRVSASVSSKTSHILAGTAPGSKLARARELDVTVVSEEDFLKMLG